MKSIYFLLLIAILSSLAAAMEQPTGNISVLPDGSRYWNDRVLVQMKALSPPLSDCVIENGTILTGIGSLDEICDRANISSIELMYNGNVRKPGLKSLVDRLYVFRTEPGADLQYAVVLLSGEPNVEYVEPIYLADLCYMPNDPYADTEWHLAHTQTLQAWDIVRGDTTRHSIVAVIDTGVRRTHPDMNQNIWVNDGEDLNHDGIPDSEDINSVDDDGNGFVDDVWGWDFGDNDNNPTESNLEHGTAVAGSVSEDTDNGVMGAAIGFSARIMVLKSFADDGTFYGHLDCLVYAAENGAKIINCSWSILQYSDIFQGLIDAVWAEDVLIIGASGYQGDTPTYPAAYNHVMAVTATDENDNLPPFASHGDFVDICAPGTDIQTIWGANEYIEVSGTSFSTAFVSGLAALVRAWVPSYTNDQVENLIISSADPVNYPDFPGRINSYNCITSVSADDHYAIKPIEFSVSAYPNPFNAQTNVSYSLPTASVVSIEIFDITGRKVTTLFEGHKESGNHSIIWNATGQVSGVYFYKFASSDYSEIKKCVLLR